MAAARERLTTLATRGGSDDPRPPWVRMIEKSTRVLMVPAALACLAMLIQIVADVTMRNLFDSPIKGTLDMTSDWWMVTTVFLALAYAQLRNEHVRATMVTALMPQTWQKGAEIGAVVLIGLVGFAMAYYGWTQALESQSLGESSSSIRGLPLWPFRFVIPVGCLALTMQCIATIYSIATTNRQQSHAEELI